MEPLPGNYLISLAVPGQVLSKETEYYWRARFFDNNGGVLEWPEPFGFKTDKGEDMNGHGIHDKQEVEITTDLDQNGIPDIEQKDIKCVNTEAGNAQMCISIPNQDQCPWVLSVSG